MPNIVMVCFEVKTNSTPSDCYYSIRQYLICIIETDHFCLLYFSMSLARYHHHFEDK